MKALKFLTLIAAIVIIYSCKPNSDEFTNKGIELFEQEDYQEAINEFSKAIKANENDTNAYYYRGRSLFSQNDFENALNDFNKVINIDQDVVNTYLYRGLCYVSLNQFENGVNDISEYIKKESDNPLAYYYRGKAYVMGSAYEKALSDFTIVLKLDTTNSDAYFMYGQLKIALSSVSDGIPFVLKAKELGHEDAFKYYKKLSLIQNAITELPKLKSSFYVNEDKINGGGWYHHRFTNKYCTHIEVPVSTNGYFYLKTHYYGDDWIFHNYITVKIGDVIYTSTNLEHFSDYNVRDNDFNGVYENLHLTKPTIDMNIIKEIANNTAKNIQIRFKGDQKYYDLTLTERNKQMIKESYLLSRYIILNNNVGFSNDGISVFNKNDVVKEKDANIKNLLILPSNAWPDADIKLNF